jgi:hypothetical protein
MKATSERQLEEPAQPAPARFRLPGFIVDDEIGLGDVVKRAASYLGMRPCGGCERRAAVLNRLVSFR